MLQRIGTELKPALAYLRSGTAIAERNAIRAFAMRFGFEIVAELKQPNNSPPIVNLTQIYGQNSLPSSPA